MVGMFVLITQASKGAFLCLHFIKNQYFVKYIENIYKKIY